MIRPWPVARGAVSPRGRRGAGLAILLAVSACAPATPAASEQAAAGASEHATPAASEQAAAAASEQAAAGVRPGTVLGEDQFIQALARTGSRFIVVAVFSAACGPCLTEALELTEKQPAWQAIGVATIGMGMDQAPAESRQFFAATGGRVRYPLYHAPWFAQQQAVEATPAVFVYSAAGELLFRTDAAASGDGVLKALEGKLAELVRPRPS